MEHKPKNKDLWSYKLNCNLMDVGSHDYSSGKEVER